MILTINTIDRNKMEIGLIKKDEHHIFEFETMDQSDDILPVISEILVQNKDKLENIETILVHEGPGSYTGVRIGITVANALAWSLNKPVLSYNDFNFDRIVHKVLRDKKFSKIALPKYQ
jgi:tRNA threonylcarbamoyladenosine biosynthesis protein TsaB